MNLKEFIDNYNEPHSIITIGDAREYMKSVDCRCRIELDNGDATKPINIIIGRKFNSPTMDEIKEKLKYKLPINARVNITEESFIERLKAICEE